MLWVHSRRGDRRVEYWDKTANQAYHFWYWTAVTYFDDIVVAKIGNFIHEGLGSNFADISNLSDYESPPPHGRTQEDWNLSQAAFVFGEALKTDSIIRNYIENYLSCTEVYPNLMSHMFTDPGSWVRSNLAGR